MQVKSIAVLVVLVVAVCAAPAGAAAVTGEPSPCASLCEPPPKVENPDPKHSILVIGIGWDTGTPATSTGLEAHQQASYLAYLNGHSNEWFTRSAPGVAPNWSFTGGGEFMIAPPKFPTGFPGNCTEANKDEILDHGETAAVAHGLDLSRYAAVVFTHERTFCNVNGFTRGNRIDLSRQVTTPMHELGHFLGLSHANALSCQEGVGVYVPLSSKCEVVPTADPYDLIGQGTGAFNAVEANALGWLSGQFIDLQAGFYSQTFTLNPWTGTERARRALRLRDGSQTLWLEYRQPVGIDAPEFNGTTHPANPGLVFHREGPPEAGKTLPSSEILDMSPTGFDPADWALPVGQTWANPLGMMQVRLDSANAQGATVTVSSRLARVPDTVGLDRKGAVTAIGAAGLHFAGSTIKNTTDCDSIGRVLASNPAGGTGVTPGSDVTVTIGEGDRTKICQ